MILLLKLQTAHCANYFIAILTAIESECDGSFELSQGGCRQGKEILTQVLKSKAKSTEYSRKLQDNISF